MSSWKGRTEYQGDEMVKSCPATGCSKTITLTRWGRIFKHITQPGGPWCKASGGLYVNEMAFTPKARL